MHRIVELANSHSEVLILTTEKDAVKLWELDFPENVQDLMYAVPIRVEFLNGDKENFDKQIFNYVNSNKRGSNLHTGRRLRKHLKLPSSWVRDWETSLSTLKIRSLWPMKSIPHFPVSTVEGHAGQLISGLLGGTRVLVMSGQVPFLRGLYHGGGNLPHPGHEIPGH